MPRPKVKSALLYVVPLLFCAQQGGATRFVSTTGMDPGNDCTSSASPCGTIQWAVDEATAGEEIRVAAGTYTGSAVVVVTRFMVDYEYKQVVFVGKPLTIRGGYTESDWTTSNPVVNVTTIDAAGDGRPVSIVDTLNEVAILDGFVLTGGDYTGLGNPSGQVNHVCRDQEEVDCGGGLFIFESAFQLLNSVVSGNVSSTVEGDGGGIYLWEARTGTIENTTVMGNVAPGQGGGVYVTSQDFPLTIRDMTVASNTANRGGGVCMASNIEALVRMEDSTVTGNSALTEEAGGLFARLTQNGLLLEMERVVVADNEAWGQGKGVLLESAGNFLPEARLVNVLFSGNTRVDGAPEATEDAVLALGPGFTNLDVTLAHVTAADNPVGSFLYAKTATIAGIAVQVTATNVLLSGFENGWVGEEAGDGELTIEDTNTLYFDVASQYLNLGGTPTFIGVDPVMGDPLLASNYRLLPGSAAIDTGADAGISDDIDGDSRPFGAAPDIGADEFAPLFIDGFESGDASAWSVEVP